MHESGYAIKERGLSVRQLVGAVQRYVLGWPCDVSGVDLHAGTATC